MCGGEQTCAADGSGYSECVCDDSAGSAGTSGSAGAGTGGTANVDTAGAGGGGPTTGSLFDVSARVMGSPCEQDSDCPTGPNGEQPLRCIPATDTVSFLTGGPQGGYCTATCETTTDCQALDPLSGCSLFDQTTGQGSCISVCTLGADTRADCPGDRAQACVNTSQDPTAQFGGCFPVCHSDAACGDGLFCDLGAGGLGLCTATEPPGAGVGAACAEDADCKSGLCLQLQDGAGNPGERFCSAFCTFGFLAGCGFDEDATDRDAICLQAAEPTGDFGDLGLCFELCDVDSDCAQAAGGWTCSSLGPNALEAFGRSGECLPPGLAATDVDAGGALPDGG